MATAWCLCVTACRRCVVRIVVGRTSFGGASAVYWSSWMALGVGNDESGERGDGVGQLSESDPVRMTHCRRVGLIGLTGPTHAVSGDGVSMQADGARQAVATTRRDGSDRHPSDTRHSQYRASHENVALASRNTGRLPATSQSVRRRSTGSLSALQAVI